MKTAGDECDTLRSSKNQLIVRGIGGKIIGGGVLVHLQSDDGSSGGLGGMSTVPS